MVSLDQVVETEALLARASAQKAELIALIRTLELPEGVVVNIYTDSRFAFGVVLVLGTLWKEDGLLIVQGNPIKYGAEILHLLFCFLAK